ncbi:MAG: DUF3575 domain-containing protein [Bacteroidota bacterium]
MFIYSKTYSVLMFFCLVAFGVKGQQSSDLPAENRPDSGKPVVMGTGSSPAPATATPARWRRNTVKVSANLFWPGLTYGYAINKRVTIQATYTSSSVVYFTDFELFSILKTWGGTSTAYTPEIRYYPFNSTVGPIGFYTGLYARYRHDKATGNYDAEAEMHSFGGGVVFGYQWIKKRGFTIDLFGGAGTMYDKTWQNEFAYKSSPIINNGFRPSGMGGCSLGYSF